VVRLPPTEALPLGGRGGLRPGLPNELSIPKESGESGSPSISICGYVNGLSSYVRNAIPLRKCRCEAVSDERLLKICKWLS